MGLFSKAKAYWEECKEYQRIYDERRMHERERDSRRPSITNLRFVTLNPAIADSPNLVKLKVKDKKAKEMFLDCIRSGRASFAEVLAIDSTLITIDEENRISELSRLTAQTLLWESDTSSGWGDQPIDEGDYDWILPDMLDEYLVEEED